MASPEPLIDSHGWITTKDEAWFAKWDQLQRENPAGMFTQTSSWLSSYQAYGFQFELLLKLDKNQEILAGLACLIIQAGPFRAYNCPWGPFLQDQSLLHESIERMIVRAKELKSFAVQLNPGTFSLNDSWQQSLTSLGFQKGNFLKKIFQPIDFNLIRLPSGNGEEQEKALLKSFSENARRNVKTGLKNQLKIQKAQTLDQTEAAYRCFEANADREGYVVRAWMDVKDSLWDAVQKGNSVIFYVEQEGKVIGSIWAAKGGRMLSYIMGGVDRTEKDLKLGHVLQWQCMLEAMSEGFTTYNISVGGSEGVVRFKSSFYPQETRTSGSYMLPLDSVKFGIFRAIFPYFERNKKLASKILKLIR